MNAAFRQRESSSARPGRRGVLLPLVAAIVCLLFAICLTVGRFGSNTRTLFRTADQRGRIEGVLASAVAETLAAIETEEPGPGAVTPDSWWARLLPPYTSDLEGTHKITLTATSEDLADGRFDVLPAELRCIHRDVKKGTAQGLLSLTVTVHDEDSGRSYRRTLLLRYIVAASRERPDAFALTVLRAPLATEEVCS